MKVTRQHVLLGALVLVALANAGDWVLSSVIQGPLKERHDRTTALDDAITKSEKLLADARRAGKKLSAWRKQSLPADTELARSLYRSWLHERVTDSGLSGATVDSGSPANRRGLYAALPFSVRGRGTLDQFTRLMFDVTSTGHLHKVESISLTPVGADQFDIALGIEALIVAGTKRRDRLGTADTVVLASAQLDDYSIISRHNIFGIGYRNPLAQATVSAIVWRNGKPRVWISTDHGDTTLKLDLHDELTLADYRARVVAATDEQVVLESNGHRIAVELGSSLADGRPVPPTP